MATVLGFDVMSVAYLAVPALITIILLRTFWLRKRYNMPPGPIGLPIFGYLFNLKPPVYRSLLSLSKIYGPIMTVKLGTLPNVFITSSKLAKEVLKTSDNILASRPPTQFSKIMIATGHDMVWTPMGHKWQENRKICNTELLSANSLKRFKHIRQHNIAQLIHTLQFPAQHSTPVVMRKHLWDLVVDNMSRMVMGSRYSGGHFEAHQIKQVVSDTLRVGNLFNMGDYVPFLNRFDVQGYSKSIREYKSAMDSISKRILAECRKNKPGSEDSFVDTLLQLNEKQQIDDGTVGNMIWNMMAAGTDTIVDTTEWALSELILHPEKQARVQAEIDTVVGKGRNVEEEDLENLKYLQMVYKETLRLHPPTPLMLPHFSTQDCKIAGYDIPANTAVHVNVFAINRDPDNWEDPETFMPERYEKENVDMRGYDFRLLPFGAGRRVCPGAGMAVLSGTFILASLMQKFEFTIPYGKKADEVDMVEEFGIVQCMRTPICALLKPRA